jgi:hypothetical protein
MPVDIVLGRPEQERPEAESYEDFGDDLASRLEASFELAREHLNTAASRRKATYDLRVRPQSFKVGQFVWYYYPRKYVGRTPKWQRCYTGPYLVVRVIPPANYVIQRSKGSQMKVVHGDKLKSWNGEALSSWLKDTPECGTEKGQDTREPEVVLPVENQNGDGQRDKRSASHDDLITATHDQEPAEETVSPGHGQRPARQRRLPTRLQEYDVR